jgi:DNA modification methylase
MRPVRVLSPLEDNMSDLSVITGDCIEVMSTMQPESVRLAVFDPVYNIGIDYGQGRKADLLPAAEYLGWLRERFIAAKRLLTSDGSFWVLSDPRWVGRFQCILEGLVGRQTSIDGLILAPFS